MDKLYDGVSYKLITPEIKRLVDVKVTLFEQKLTTDAPLADIVGVLTGYELAVTDKYCGGYCDYLNQTIAYNTELARGHADIKKSLFHEMGHAIQAELGIFDKLPWLLSANLKMEQQCESIAFYLYNKTHKSEPLAATQFNSYFKADDVDFLRKWYTHWLEDDLLTNGFHLHSSLSRY